MEINKKKKTGRTKEPLVKNTQKHTLWIGSSDCDHDETTHAVKKRTTYIMYMFSIRVKRFGIKFEQSEDDLRGLSTVFSQS